MQCKSRRKNLRFCAFSCTLLSVCASNLYADTFQVRGGGTISGKLLNDPASSIYKIRTYDGAEIEISSGKLNQKIVISAEQEQAYKTLIAGKEDTVELHRAISQECISRDQKELAYAHRERVVELDPSDENWKALGEHIQDKLTGEWIHRDKKFKRQGMVELPGNKWATLQSKAIADSDRNLLLAKADVAKRVDQALRNLNERGPKRDKAAEFFSNLNDPLAIDKIEELLKADIASGGRGDMFMALLAKMPGSSAAGVFVSLAMNSPNAEIVRQASEMLERTDESREIAFNLFMVALSNKDPGLVDRAGTHLQIFADKRAIPALIERLKSFIKRTTSAPGTNAVSTGGGVSQSFGSSKTETLEYKHHTVLGALLGLADGANFSFEIPEWRQWYAYKYAKTNLDLRRNE